MIPPGRYFSPSQHLIAAFEGRSLSVATRLLALVLAAKLRQCAGGQWLVWRGRESLAKLAHLSPRTITAARRELIEAGLFRAVRGVRTIETDSGRSFAVAKGVIVLELVMDVTAFVERRDEARKVVADEIESQTHFARIQVQKRFMNGEVDDAERRRLEDEIRRTARRNRSRRATG